MPLKYAIVIKKILKEHAMAIVTFYRNIKETEDIDIKIAIIASRYRDKWVFCFNKKRQSYEMPAGRKEDNESIDMTARRELVEETKATSFSIEPISLYSVSENGNTSFGKLFFASIYEMEKNIEDPEIDHLIFRDTLPEPLTFKNIQSQLFKYANDYYKDRYS